MLQSPLSRILVALTASLALAGLAGNASAQDKLDRALRESGKSGNAHRVIVKSKPGYEAWARHLLGQKDKTILAELPSVGGFVVTLTSDEMDAICGSRVLDGCSADAPVMPSALWKPRPPVLRQGNTLVGHLRPKASG